MNKMNSKVWIVIPAKDEATRIGQVIKGLQEQGYRNIVVVNDGSIDNTAEVALHLGTTVLTHLMNLGPGAATQTGIEYTIEQNADVIVTIDGDTQHFPADVPALIRKLKSEELDVVIGSRFLRENDIPTTRLIYNKIGNWFTFLMTGGWVTDSQSGMKAMTANFAKKMTIHLNGYEFCTEFIQLMQQHNAKFAEVPIKVRYTEETMKKGQSLFNGFRMVRNLIRQFFLIER